MTLNFNNIKKTIEILHNNFVTYRNKYTTEFHYAQDELKSIGVIKYAHKKNTDSGITSNVIFHNIEIKQNLSAHDKIYRHLKEKSLVQDLKPLYDSLNSLSCFEDVSNALNIDIYFFNKNNEEENSKVIYVKLKINNLFLTHKPVSLIDIIKSLKKHLKPLLKIDRSKPFFIYKINNKKISARSKKEVLFLYQIYDPFYKIDFPNLQIQKKKKKDI
jgi:hypothetical protein